MPLIILRVLHICECFSCVFRMRQNFIQITIFRCSSWSEQICFCGFSYSVGIWHLALGTWLWVAMEMKCVPATSVRYCIASTVARQCENEFLRVCVVFSFSSENPKSARFDTNARKKNNKSIYTAEITGLNTCSISIKRTIFFFSFIGSMDSIEFGKSQAIRLILLLMLCTA